MNTEQKIHEYRELLAEVRLTIYADLDRCPGRIQMLYSRLKQMEDLDRDPATGKFAKEL